MNAKEEIRPLTIAETEAAAGGMTTEMQFGNTIITIWSDGTTHSVCTYDVKKGIGTCTPDHT